MDGSVEIGAVLADPIERREVQVSPKTPATGAVEGSAVRTRCIWVSVQGDLPIGWERVLVDFRCGFFDVAVCEEVVDEGFQGGVGDEEGCYGLEGKVVDDHVYKLWR